MSHFEKRKEKTLCFVRFFYQIDCFRHRRMKKNVYPFFRYEMFTIMARLPVATPVSQKVIACFLFPSGYAASRLRGALDYPELA